MKNLLFLLGMTAALSLLSVSAYEPLVLPSFSWSNPFGINCNTSGRDLCKLPQFNTSSIIIDSVTTSVLSFVEIGNWTSVTSMNGTLNFHYTANVGGRALQGTATSTFLCGPLPDDLVQGTVKVGGLQVMTIPEDHLDFVKKALYLVHQDYIIPPLQVHINNYLKSSKARSIPITIPTYLNTTSFKTGCIKSIIHCEKSFYTSKDYITISKVTGDVSLVDAGAGRNGLRSVNGTLTFQYEAATFVRDFDHFQPQEIGLRGTATLSVAGSARKTKNSVFRAQLSGPSSNIVITEDYNGFVEDAIEEMFERYYIDYLERHINEHLQPTAAHSTVHVSLRSMIKKF